MPFAVTTPSGQVVRLDDLPLAELGPIAKDAGLSGWVELVTAPAADHVAAQRIYDLCCAKAGDDTTQLTPRLVVDVFSVVPDDLPTEYEDGIPKAEADPTTPG